MHDLAATLAHRGADGAVWVDGAVGLAARVHRVAPESWHERQPLVDTQGNAVVFDGRLDNRHELLGRLAATGDVDAGVPDPALVLAAYRAFGDGVAERLAGDFTLGLFDGRRRRLLLARDAIGVRPLYWTRAGETFVFASEIKALLAHPAVRARPDDDVLASLLLDGPPDARGATPFADVFSLLPAHAAVLTRGHLAVRRYWDFDVTREERTQTFGECAEGFREHFERAVRRRLRSAQPAAVSVSGGLDSSSVFCSALGLARRDPALPGVEGVAFVVADGGPADEREFLGEIERAHGVRIERVPALAASVLAGAVDAVWHTEMPLLDEQAGTGAALFRAARALGARTVLGGHWGDQVLCSRAYLVDFALGGRWREVRRHLAEVPRWFTDAEPGQFRRGFAVDLAKALTPRALHPFLRRLRRSPERPWYTETLRRRARWTRARGEAPRAGSAHARAIYEAVRSGYHVRCMEWQNKVGAAHGLDLSFPFLDRDLLAFVMALPGGLHARGGVPKAILREALRPDLPPAIAHRRWKADFSRLVNEGVRREGPPLAAFLDGVGAAVRGGYVNGAVVRAQLGPLLDRLDGPTCDIAWSLSDLVGLETWLRTFFDRTGASPAAMAPARGATS